MIVWIYAVIPMRSIVVNDNLDPMAFINLLEILVDFRFVTVVWEIWSMLSVNVIWVAQAVPNIIIYSSKLAQGVQNDDAFRHIPRMVLSFCVLYFVNIIPELAGEEDFFFCQ